MRHHFCAPLWADIGQEPGDHFETICERRQRMNIHTSAGPNFTHAILRLQSIGTAIHNDPNEHDILAGACIGGFFLSPNLTLVECLSHENSLGFAFNDVLDRKHWRFTSGKGVGFGYRPILIRSALDESKQPDKAIWGLCLQQTLEEDIWQWDEDQALRAMKSMTAPRAADWLADGKCRGSESQSRLAFENPKDAVYLFRALKLVMCQQRGPRSQLESTAETAQRSEGFKPAMSLRRMASA